MPPEHEEWMGYSHDSQRNHILAVSLCPTLTLPPPLSPFLSLCPTLSLSLSLPRLFLLIGAVTQCPFCAWGDRNLNWDSDSNQPFCSACQSQYAINFSLLGSDELPCPAQRGKNYVSIPGNSESERRGRRRRERSVDSQVIPMQTCSWSVSVPFMGL